MTKLNPEIFRKSDIRGIVGKHLTEETVRIIGRAIGTFMIRHGASVVTLGYDNRLSSLAFRDALADGILSTGCDILDIGMVPTPLLYFSLFHLETDGGVMITGSHNPAEFNGFKICLGANSLFGKSIQELYHITEIKDFVIGKGVLLKKNIIDNYITKITSLINISRDVKFVVDGGNGCFGAVGPKLFEKLNLKPVELYWQPDGRFPNHHPDPAIPENLKDLAKKVCEEDAEFGIGFDCDVDRIGVVDNKGNIIWGDQLLMVFSRDILMKNPGAIIIGDVKCSQTLFEDIKENGGVPVIAPAGHSIIKDKMNELHALMAGETSGHISFADNYFGYDDAIFAACRLLEIISESDKKIAEMLPGACANVVNTPVINVDCPDNQKFKIIRELRDFFRDKYQFVDVDGIRLNFSDGWALVRASNTQPALTLRFEADTVERLEEIKDIVFTPLMEHEVIYQNNMQLLSNIFSNQNVCLV